MNLLCEAALAPQAASCSVLNFRRALAGPFSLMGSCRETSSFMSVALGGVLRVKSHCCNRRQDVACVGLGWPQLLMSPRETGPLWLVLCGSVSCLQLTVLLCFATYTWQGVQTAPLPCCYGCVVMACLYRMSSGCSHALVSPQALHQTVAAGLCIRLEHFWMVLCTTVGRF